MRDHPLTPMRDSNLMRLLEPQVSQPVGLANRLTVARGAEALKARLSDLAEHGVAHVVVDAVANDDLYVIAEACRHMPLMTGGSAVAMPLPELWLRDGLLSKDTNAAAKPGLSGRAIILSGSCSAMTNKQVALWRSQGGPAYQLDPLDLADNGPDKALTWLAAQASDATPIIYATADPASVKAVQARLGVTRAGQIVEDALAALAIATCDGGTRRFVIAGGETSGAVTKALGITRLDIGAEIAAGVPWCFAERGGLDVAITLKSGNFGAESFFADALSKLGS